MWVHSVVCRNGAHLQRWGNFIKFSSIPTEWRNKSFKMDIRHCFQGWKLSKPYVTRWGVRHSPHLDALDWGIRLWFVVCGLILPPALKRWGPPRRQGLCSHVAHLWATSDSAPRSEAVGIPQAAGVM